MKTSCALSTSQTLFDPFLLGVPSAIDATDSVPLSEDPIFLETESTIFLKGAGIISFAPSGLVVVGVLVSNKDFCSDVSDVENGVWDRTLSS